MASRYEEEPPVSKSCDNCGETGKLYRCSRCHVAYFCSLACHKSYWPFHSVECKRNEFADAIESQEPKFARWMRRHGKMAALRDDEVDRLERAGRAVTGPGRGEVMGDMYGRLEPRPREPKFSAEEMAAMQQAKAKEQAAGMLLSAPERAWREIRVPDQLGLDCGSFKWRQNQSVVELFVRVPANAKVLVKLSPRTLKVDVGGEVMLQGQLYRDICMDGSTWSIGDDDILEVSLLKANRRGRYQDGTCNADTFWKAVLKGMPARFTLQLQHPPTCYYWSEIDDGGEDGVSQPLRLPAA